MNIAEILKAYPEGTELYTPIWGKCKLIKVEECFETIIRVDLIERRYDRNESFLSNGAFYEAGECVLFPSKENRDWNTMIKKPKIKSNLKPFDKVLVRDSNTDYWKCAFYEQYLPSNLPKQYPYRTINRSEGFSQCIPYEGNEYLLGTDKKPDID